MNHILSAIGLSLSSNSDSFAVGVAYGTKRIRIGTLSNLLMAFISALGTYLSMSLGEKITQFLDHDVANFLGSFVLVAIGVWGILNTLRAEIKSKRKKETPSSLIDELDYEVFVEDPSLADLDNSKVIDVRESIPLGLALTINNLANGIGAGLSGINIYLTTFLCFIFSILSIVIGYIIGEKLTARLSGKWLDLISGSMMIAIGIYEYYS